MSIISFMKMHGCSNDFVVIDQRINKIAISTDVITLLANRHKGIGCDQVIIISHSTTADCFLHVYNSDASISGTCGNAIRCIAWIIMQEKSANTATIETISNLYQAYLEENGQVMVDMGKPKLDWQDIPLSIKQDTMFLVINNLNFAKNLPKPTAVNMGNPHIVYFLDDIAKISLTQIGPELELNGLFPEKVNISFAQVVNDNIIKLRVWERGAGETMACGSAACATLVAAVRRNLIKTRESSVELPGGILKIKWSELDNHVFMCGDVATSFHGIIQIGNK